MLALLARISAVILGSFIPGFRIADFLLQVFGGEMRRIEFFASRCRQFLPGRKCFSITHDKCEPNTDARGNNGAAVLR